MSPLFWIIVFLVSLAALVKGADWFLAGSERIGLSLGIAPFIIGVTIVAMGTSLPELISSLFAVFKGASDVVIANVVGSNIANIFLVVGVATILGKKLVISKDLLDLDLPLLLTTTALFAILVWDGRVTLAESIILLVAFVIHFLYTVTHREEVLSTDDIVLPEMEAKKKHGLELVHPGKKASKINRGDIVWAVIGVLGLVFGAQYLIESVIALSTIFNIGTGVIAVSAIALGTSLPELLVSGKAALQGKPEVAIGNIFGSNIFNMLIVVGIPGLFGELPANEATLSLALPTMVIATVLFILAAMSKRMYIWEGTFFLLLYIVFIGKLFGFL